MSFHSSPVSFYPETAEPILRPVPVAKKAEKDDDYPTVVRLNPDWRVIECKDGIQWILQRRKGQSDGKPLWKSTGYCRSKEGLLRCIREDAGGVRREAQSILEALPSRIEP